MILLSGAAGVALMASAGQAFAQSAPAPAEGAAAPEELGEVVVTGSRIRGVGAVGSNVVALDREIITQSTGNSVMEVLASTPQILNFGVSTQTTTSTAGNSNLQRASSINLHGINQAATLVLFNGRRGPPMGTGGAFTDPSYIPTISLERVEVIADGASAIYGADAVAGVVNFITRKNFNGLEVRARYGFADDHKTTLTGIIGGHDWGSGHIMVAGEFAWNDALSGRDRDYVRSDLRDRGGRDYRGSQCVTGNILAGGVSYAIPAGGVTQATANQLLPNTVNRCETYRDLDIVPKQQRAGLTYYVTQDIGERVKVFSEGFYSRRMWKNYHTTSGSSNLLASVVIPSTNPFFVRPPGFTGNSVTVEYSFEQDFGGLYAGRGFERTYGGTVGSSIDLGREWKAELTGTWGYDRTFYQAERVFTTALTAAQNATNPANALNPFRPGTTNPAVIAGINSFVFQPEGKSLISVYEARADGPLFNLPAGAVRLAVGVARTETSLWSPTRTGVRGQALTGPVTMADRKVDAGYAELFVPIVSADNAVPGIRRLDLSLAGRIDKYDDVGRTENPKVGLNYSPVEDLVFKASYGTSFRAPNLSDVTPTRPGNGINFQTWPDPLSPTGNSSGFNVSTGNPGLSPETAKTYSFGAEFTPSSVPGLRLNATFWKIDFKNQVQTLTASSTVLQDPAVAFRITRNPSQALIDSYLNSGIPVNGVRPPVIAFIIDSRPINQGATSAEGIDFEAGYRWSTESWGDFDAGVAGTYFLKFKTQQTTTQPFVDRLNTLNNPVEFRARARLGWRRDAVEATLFLNHVNSYKNNTVTPVQTVKAYNTFDAHFGYDLGGLGPSWLSDTQVTIDASNLFDKDPPFVNIQGGYDPVQANILGRLITVGINKRF